MLIFYFTKDTPCKTFFGFICNKYRESLEKKIYILYCFYKIFINLQNNNSVIRISP